MARFLPRDCWVIVPAHNEHRHIADVVLRCNAVGFPNVIVVDDGSKDQTFAIASEAGAVVLRHKINLHKGAAMLTGAIYASKHGAKALVFLDGDGQHAPEELPAFLKELNKGNAVVFGSRKEVKKMPVQRRLGKFLTSGAVRFLFRIRVADVLSGYRAITTAAFYKIRWLSTDYAVESEMVARVGMQQLQYSQIEISTIYHDKYKGVTFLDGLKILMKLLWWRLSFRIR